MELIKDIFNGIINNFGAIGVFASLLGAVVAIITLMKVKSVREAQIHERMAFQEILKLDELENLLATLFKLITVSRDELIQKGFEEVDSLLEQIPEYRGSIKGALDALTKYFDQTKGKITTFPQYFSRGYYTDEFLLNEMKNAHKIIRICAKRNIRITSIDILAAISAKARSGCKIELLTIGPETNDEILWQIMETMPLPPNSVEDLRNQLNHHTQTYLEYLKSLPEKVRKRISYFQFSGYPPFHIVQVDKLLHLGITGFYKMPSDLKIIKNRPYITFHASDPFAQKIIQQFKLISTRSTQVD